MMADGIYEEKKREKVEKEKMSLFLINL